MNMDNKTIFHLTENRSYNMCKKHTLEKLKNLQEGKILAIELFIYDRPIVCQSSDNCHESSKYNVEELDKD